MGPHCRLRFHACRRWLTSISAERWASRSARRPSVMEHVFRSGFVGHPCLISKWLLVVSVATRSRVWCSRHTQTSGHTPAPGVLAPGSAARRGLVWRQWVMPTGGSGFYRKRMTRRALACRRAGSGEDSMGAAVPERIACGRNTQQNPLTQASTAVPQGPRHNIDVPMWCREDWGG